MREERLRVNVVAPQFPPEIGGIQRYAFEVASELSRRSHRVRVLTLRSSPGDGEADSFEVVRRLRGDWWTDRRIVREYAATCDVWHVMNAAWVWVASEVSAPAVATVFGNDLLSPNPVGGLALKRRLRLPFGSRLDFGVARWRTPRLMKKGFRAVRHVVPISNYTNRLLLELYPDCAGKTTPIFLGLPVDYLRLPRTRSTASGTRILTVTRLSERRKSVDVVIRALAELKEKYDFHYDVVGAGPLAEELERLVDDSGLRGRVNFAGSVSDEQLKEFYRASDLFVLTSIAAKDTVEGFGLVYLEANACGTPVLAARHGGVEDAVRDGVSGMLIDEVTVSGVRTALERFLSGGVSFDPDTCRRFAAGFSWPSTVDALEQIYESVIP